jgi:hypothetical protein
MAVVGVLNLAVGLLSLLTGFVRLSPAVSGGFVAVGLFTAAVGALVWRGSWPATVGALTIFAMLLVFQLTELLAEAGEGAPAQSVAQDPRPRLVVLGLLVAALAVATWRLRRTRTRARTER